MLISIWPGAFAIEPSISVFSVEAAEGVDYDGYLVSVRGGISPRISPLQLGVEQVVENLYKADSIQDIQRIWREDQIYYIEPNYNIVPLGVPNDPSFGRQWDMRMVNAPAFWGSGIDTGGVRVAVIDSGIIQHHEDLNHNLIVQGFNYIDRNTNVRDTMGHGTNVTGIIAAVRGNGVGMAGLVDQVTIIPLKVMDVGRGSLSMAIQAVYDAVQIHDSDVINMSFGIEGHRSSRALEDAVNYAASQGVLLVAAVGNDGTGARVYPAGYDSVIGVGAVNSNGNVAYFSQRNDTVFVTAPGQAVLTTGHGGPQSYVYVSGTSFAAPYVAAMAAVAKAVAPDITTDGFKELLIRSAIDRGAPGYDVHYGHGIIDFARFAAIITSGFWDIYDHWAQRSIENMVNIGLFSGTGDHTFEPDTPISRAMFVTVLGRLYQRMGGTVPQRNDGFIDTQSNSWYSSYVAWAAENGIVTGIGGNRFAPTDPVHRQQAAVILYRFALYLGLDVSYNSSGLVGFVDRGDVAEWARAAMIWAVDRGLINGVPVSGGLALQPAASSTRAQVAVILERFINGQGLLLNAAA